MAVRCCGELQSVCLNEKLTISPSTALSKLSPGASAVQCDGCAAPLKFRREAFLVSVSGGLYLANISPTPSLNQPVVSSRLLLHGDDCSTSLLSFTLSPHSHSLNVCQLRECRPTLLLDNTTATATSKPHPSNKCASLILSNPLLAQPRTTYIIRTIYAHNRV